MLGVFGTCMSVVQLALVERHALTHAAWSWQVCKLVCAADLLCVSEQRFSGKAGTIRQCSSIPVQDACC